MAKWPCHRKLWKASVHAGMGSLDDGTTWTPTGDATVGIAVGLLPVQVGLHVDAGGLAGTVNIDTVHPFDVKGRQIILAGKLQKQIPA